MRNVIFIFTLFGAFLFFPVGAKESADKDCTAKNHCVADSKFTAQVGNIRKRGKFILLQINYNFTGGDFTGFDVRYRGASLIDSEGNEATIEGKQIEYIRVESTGGKKNLSLKFKAEGFEWADTFDLDLKANNPHGSIAFFDLKVI